jgi:hypothetical protein
MSRQTTQPSIPLAIRALSSRGSIMVLAMLAIVVMVTLASSILTVSHSENVNQRREQRGTRAFYAAEAGALEALARLNLSPTGTTDDEVELPWDTANNAPRNPAAVRDPAFIVDLPAEPNPVNYSDSTVPTWRFWNYDPSWRYTGSGSAGEGNYTRAPRPRSKGIWRRRGGASRTTAPRSGRW